MFWVATTRSVAPGYFIPHLRRFGSTLGARDKQLLLRSGEKGNQSYDAGKKAIHPGANAAAD